MSNYKFFAVVLGLFSGFVVTTPVFAQHQNNNSSSVYNRECSGNDIQCLGSESNSQGGSVNDSGNSANTNNIGVGVEGSESSSSSSAQGGQGGNGGEVTNTTQGGDTNANNEGVNNQNKYESTYRNDSIHNNPNGVNIYRTNVCGIEAQRGMGINNTTISGGVGDVSGSLSLSSTEAKPSEQEITAGLKPAIDAQTATAAALSEILTGNANEKQVNDASQILGACNGASVQAAPTPEPKKEPVIVPPARTNWECTQEAKSVYDSIKDLPKNKKDEILKNLPADLQKEINECGDNRP
jgi:hypothetical protein